MYTFQYYLFCLEYLFVQILIKTVNCLILLPDYNLSRLFDIQDEIKRSQVTEIFRVEKTIPIFRE